ncbi:MAG: MerR family transcriptional regulator [Porticoccaceae bacterium]|jgi:DNA-binding transcriptional MerR regulator
MKIGELARKTGASKDAIRHYVSLGLLVAERNSSNGYQIFAAEAVSRLRFIKTARQLGFHLDDIKQMFGDAERAHSPCPRVRDLMEHRINETRKTIKELTDLCDRMESSMAEWKNMPDTVPDGHSVCRLIESQIQSQDTN